MSAGHAGYLQLLEEMKQLHLKKAADYGSDTDPLANMRSAVEIGIEPWKAAWLRAKDKIIRINQYCLKGTLENESVEDSFMDLAAYCLLALALRRESTTPICPDDHKPEIEYGYVECTLDKGHYFKSISLWPPKERGNSNWDHKCIYCGLYKVYNTDREESIYFRS